MVNSAQAKDLLKALDPASYMAECGMEPDPWQVEYLRSEKDTLLLCSRQSGKSTATAALAAHHAKYHDDALVLLLSRSQRQSSELMIKVRRFYGRDETRESLEKKSALQLEFKNGSRILSLPSTEETILGYSDPSMVIFDEAARVSEELYRSIRPMRAVSGGRMVALSTPFGKRGWFYNLWIKDNPKWLKIKVTWEDCPRITEEFIEEERRNNPESWIQQDFYCEFVDTTDAVFSHDDVMEMMSDETVTPLFAGAV